MFGLSELLHTLETAPDEIRLALKITAWALCAVLAWKLLTRAGRDKSGARHHDGAEVQEISVNVEHKKVEGTKVYVGEVEEEEKVAGKGDIDGKGAGLDEVDGGNELREGAVTPGGTKGRRTRRRG